MASTVAEGVSLSTSRATYSGATAGDKTLVAALAGVRYDVISAEYRSAVVSTATLKTATSGTTAATTLLSDSSLQVTNSPDAGMTPFWNGATVGEALLLNIADAGQVDATVFYKAVTP